ncbi:hypothetical protein DKT75_14845 [Leucothrix arctica]|uniref:Uncharacterized protein n=1 Tax=Leucothrix arctica TaxID=1481894 RepID=A0A317C8J2_9GAMM|nr:hypothetical protein DKT75_14845 [Leucothrix arctica]
MGVCGADFFCDFLSQYIKIYSPLQYTLIQVTLTVTVVLGSFLFGRVYATASGKKDKEEAFINGIMYHINILAYNDAKIPHKHDAESDEHLVKAQSRLAKKIKPKLPS